MDIRQKDGSRDAFTRSCLRSLDAPSHDGPYGEIHFHCIGRQSILNAFLSLSDFLFYLPTTFQGNISISRSKKRDFDHRLAPSITWSSIPTSRNGTSTALLLDYLPVYQQWNYTIWTVYKLSAPTFSTLGCWAGICYERQLQVSDNDESQPRISDYRSDEQKINCGLKKLFPTFGKNHWVRRNLLPLHQRNINRRSSAMERLMIWLYQHELDLCLISIYPGIGYLLNDRLVFHSSEHHSHNLQTKHEEPSDQFSPRFRHLTGWTKMGLNEMGFTPCGRPIPRWVIRTTWATTWQEEKLKHSSQTR